MSISRVAADTLHRQLIGIVLSELAATLVKARLHDQLEVLGEIHHRTDIPRRTDVGNLPNYRTHKNTLFGKQEGPCGGCQMACPFRNFEIDHVIPHANGGSTTSTTCSCSAAPATGPRATEPELIAKLRERGQLAA